MDKAQIWISVVLENASPIQKAVFEEVVLPEILNCASGGEIALAKLVNVGKEEN